MEQFLLHCSAVFSQQAGLWLLFFMGGLTGSLTHCLVMCGPVVASQSACHGACGKHIGAASQWQYHLGRLVTYGALGFFATLMGRQLSTLPYWPALSAIMMVLAAGFFLFSAATAHSYPLPYLSLRGGFVRGILMSFMPCGLIYAALMMAATLTNPFTGMAAMWLFVLGTVPALWVASGGVAMLAVKWQEIIRRIGRVGMAFNGLALLVIATKMVR
ncbi:MAG: sulfite exporter TauE/SafE family protein [Rickettsiales bacterium]|nr:sulfite exporter TauE/SafE family protein [Rickettsiales bacterium]